MSDLKQKTPKVLQKIDRSEWELVKFSDVVREVRAVSSDPVSEGIERVVGLEDLSPLDIHIRTWSDIKKGTTFTRKFKKGQVLFGKRRAYQRKAALAEFDGICSGDIVVMEAIEEKMESGLLPFLVHSEAFYNWAVSTSAGSLSPRTKFRDLAKFEFRIPPRDIQKKICELLQATDESEQKKVSLKNELLTFKTVLIDNLLLKGIGHSEFQKTKLGNIPKDWKVVRLGNHCRSIQYGFTASATEKNVGPKLLRITDIQNNSVNWETVPYCKCSDVDKFKLEDGDIVFARTGATTGKSYLIASPPLAVFASYLIRVKVGEDLEAKFIYLFFQSSTYWRQIQALTSGSAQGGFNASKLGDLQIVLPSRREQKEITDLLSKVDENIMRNNSAVDSDKVLRQSIINSLL